ncbi:hypothetical protein DFAR_2120003 [Desulfarculales bacterium]
MEVDRHYYSVPHKLVGKKFNIRYKERAVECFHKGQASGQPSSHPEAKRPHPTLAEHMPRSHQEHAKWTPERITNWIHKIGEATTKLTEGIMKANGRIPSKASGPA